MGNTEIVRTQTHILGTPDLTSPSAIPVSLKAQLRSHIPIIIVGTVSPHLTASVGSWKLRL